jgi:transcriptional regulator with XRE-family HTH domain
MRWRGKIAIPPKACRAVKRIYKEMNNQRATFEEVAKRAGVNASTIKEWRRGTVPNFENIVAVVGALGGKVNIRFHDAIDSFGGRDE